MTREELIKMIANRDGIGYDEAEECVEDCAQDISVLLDRDSIENATDLYQEVVDILADDLGLEPDYLDLVLEVV